MSPNPNNNHKFFIEERRVLKKLIDMSEPESTQLLQAIGVQIRAIEGIFGIERLQFAVLILNDPTVAHCLSNCERERVMIAMRQAADGLKGGNGVLEPEPGGESC